MIAFVCNTNTEAVRSTLKAALHPTKFLQTMPILDFVKVGLPSSCPGDLVSEARAQRGVRFCFAFVMERRTPVATLRVYATTVALGQC